MQRVRSSPRIDAERFGYFTHLLIEIRPIRPRLFAGLNPDYREMLLHHRADQYRRERHLSPYIPF